jgi:outer membrane protein OmpA-like peptidoglycan-associated protein
MKILLSLLLFTFSLYAKEDFSVIVHKPYDAALFDVVEDYDRTISAVGFSKEFKANYNSQNVYHDPYEYLAHQSTKYGSQMTLIKVDNSANIILSKVAKLNRFNKAVALTKTPTNGYFVGGYTLDGSLVLAKLDANANLLYSKLFGTKNYDRMSNLVALSDGGVLAVGSSFTSRDTVDSMFQTGLGNNDIFITRFSKDGKILWSKKYGTAYDDNGIDAVEAADGSIVVVSTLASDKRREVTFMRLTENGNKIWLKHFISDANARNLVIPKKIIRLRDNSFVVSLIQYNQVQKEHIRLIKFDLYQNILADKEIQTSYPSALLDIKEFSNGSLMGVGYVKDKLNTDALAMLLNSDLSMLKQEHYGGENYDIFYALTILHNSEVAAVGIHTDNNSQEANMWLVKLKSDASMATIETNLNYAQAKTKVNKSPFDSNFFDKQTFKKSIYQTLTQFFAKELAAKQISISRDLTIDFIAPSLYFKTGSYHFSKEQENFFNIFSKKFSRFLDQYRNHIIGISLNGHTSSEWKNSSLDKRYLNNASLSLKRAYTLWSTLYLNADSKNKKWLTKRSHAEAYSFSKAVKQRGHENKKASRRVTLHIIAK